VREQPVITDGKPEASQQPHAEKQADLEPPDRPIEQQAQRDQRAKQRQHIENDEMAALQLMKVAALDDPDYLGHGAVHGVQGVALKAQRMHASPSNVNLFTFQGHPLT